MPTSITRFWFLLLLLSDVHALKLVDQRLQLKTGSMLGSVGVSIAQWDLEFDEDLFYWESPPCAPGLTRDALTVEAVAANPCWAGCDFTSSDPTKCGQPFNSTDPSCQAICNSHPKKALLCDYTNRPWYTFAADIETPSFNISIGEMLHLRFNWLQLEQGFRLDALPSQGQVQLAVDALMDATAKLDTNSYCAGFDSPDPYANVCPSAQCFYYGSWEISMIISAEQSLDDYSATVSVFLRTFALGQPNVRRTEPRVDAPQTLPLSITPLHTPLQFGVPVEAIFPSPFSIAANFYQLTTTYCGLISLQHEKATWTRFWSRVGLGVSTDPTNPFPASLASDILFVDGSIKPIWICPAPNQTTVSAFFTVARYTASGDPPLAGAEMHYFTVDYYRPEDNWKSFRLGSTSADSGFSRYTNFPPLANWGTGLSADLFRVSCPTTQNPGAFEYIDCRAGSAFFGTCLEFLIGLPADPWSISLLPVPNIVRSANPEGFGNIIYPAMQPIAGKKLSAFLILETTLDGSVLSQTLGTNWSSLWSQCVLHLGSDTSITAGNGSWIIADLALVPSEPECSYAEFKELAQEISSGIRYMSRNPLSAYSERVSIDELTFHEPWQGCNSFIASELSSFNSSEVLLFRSKTCLDSSVTSDPCCNNDLSWTECCVPRDLTASVDALELNSSATAEMCAFNSCVEPLLDEYYRAVLNNQIGGCAGPDLNARLRAPIRVYRDCREAAFGDDFQLPSCSADSDCTSLVANTSSSSSSIYCNQVTKQCAFRLSDSVAYFFECLAENLPVEARIKLIALNKWTIEHEAELAPKLQQRYGQSVECVDMAFGAPWSQNNAHLSTTSFLPGCSVRCDYEAVDVSYQTPPWCELRTDSVCSYQWTIASSTVGCDTAVCNWDQSGGDCNEDLLGSWFCGVCESDFVCTQVSDVASEQQCVALPGVCFLANGTVRTDLTEEQCTNEAFSCTLACSNNDNDGGGACTSEAACTSIGHCEPDDQIYEAMAGSSWEEGVTPEGFCALPMSPFNDPDCSDRRLGSLPTSYGCVVYSNCTGDSTTVTCTPSYNTEQSCALLADLGGVWWPRYNSRDKCLGAYGCQEELAGLRSLSSLGTRLRSPKDAVQCGLCGGEMQQLAEWIAGRWLPGTARRPQWIERRLVSRYNLSSSVDFIGLYNDVYTSSRAAVAFQLQNNIQCSYQSINGLLATVSCACTGTGLSSADCFPERFISSVGLGQACPLTSNTIIAPPARLSYQEGDVSSTLQDQCVEFAIDRINARYFFGEAPPPISTGFAPEFTVRGWNSVVNQAGALVGQVVGDGIDIHFTSNGKSLEAMEVCLLLSTYIPLDQQQPFTIYSLGYWTGQSNPATVVPHADLFNATLQDGYVCALARLPGNGEDVSFVPIAIRPDWQGQPSARFSDGQKALLYIVASLYAILCAVVVVQMARLISVAAWSFAVATNYIWVLLFFMAIIRAIYIYLVAANVLGQQNSHLLVDFWMMDLPTLIYLIVNCTIAVSFLYFLLGSKRDTFQSTKYFWATLLSSIAFIVAIFVAILLAFNYAVVDTQGSHGPDLCSTYTDNSDAARVIRIVYECLLFAIALLIAVVGGLVAAKLWWDMRAQDGTSSLLALGCVSSFGILSDSLAFLIYYIVNNPTPYFAIVLIFTEILPTTFLVARVANRQIQNNRRSRETSGHLGHGLGSSGSEVRLGSRTPSNSHSYGN